MSCAGRPSERSPAIIRMSPGGMWTSDNGMVCRSLIETTIISLVAGVMVVAVGSGRAIVLIREVVDDEVIALIGM